MNYPTNEKLEEFVIENMDEFLETRIKNEYKEERMKDHFTKEEWFARMKEFYTSMKVNLAKEIVQSFNIITREYSIFEKQSIRLLHFKLEPYIYNPQLFEKNKNTEKMASMISINSGIVFWFLICRSQFRQGFQRGCENVFRGSKIGL